MSSNLNRSTSHPGQGDVATRSIGWDSGIRLGFYYSIFFTLVFIGVFAAAYLGYSSTIHGRELDIVHKRAAEYRAWYSRTGWDGLVTRMNEQSLDSGDVMFVRIAGSGLNRIHIVPPVREQLSVEELGQLDPSVWGSGIKLGRDRWAITSMDLGNGSVLQAGKNSLAGEATLARLRWVNLITLVPAMIAAMLMGAWLTYRAMSPIRRLINTMQEILDAGDLGRRAAPERGRNELNALVYVFNSLLTRNEALIDAMRHSLDNVAHDFRTPLSRLRVTSERALLENSDPEQLRDALADCVEESEHLGRLLTTLMDVAEAEAGAMRLNLEAISLPDLIESVIELYELVAEDKKIQLETDLPDDFTIRADGTRLGQALANLLDNAIKFSPEDSAVHIALRDSGGGATITVRDEGTGIRQVDIPHIWERLFRAEPSRGTPGMGLGLSFVKAIVEAHGGTVSVESAVNQGSTFQLELPSHPASTLAPPSR